MLNIKKTHVFLPLLIISFTFLLAGCFGQSSEEKMFEVLEAVVNQEKGFEDQQQPLVDLEKKEKELYEKIISLGSKEKEQIVKLSDEALTVVSERKEHMENEQKSLKSSREKFETISPIIQELDDKELKNKASDLYEIMSSRYEIHDKLYDYYMKGIQYDKELYNMLKDKEASLGKLDDQVSKINQTYEKVIEANKQFNQKTKKYNETKLDFYKKAGFNVNN
jgi:hypothetical protein